MIINLRTVVGIEYQCCDPSLQGCDIVHDTGKGGTQVMENLCAELRLHATPSTAQTIKKSSSLYHMIIDVIGC